MVDLYVFDLDGTLIDSRRDLAESGNELLAECGAPPLAEQEIGGMVGEGAAVLVARLFDASGVRMPEDGLARYLAIYDRRLLNHTRVYDGILDVLEALHIRASLAVLTNKPVAATRRILEALNLTRYFRPDTVIGGDGAFPRKPNGDGLRHLIAAAGVPPSSTLLVGDSLIDLRTARGAGVPFCAARYGFGFTTIPSSELTGATMVIHTARDLLAV